jgi:GNAT superfamily N-acetyltransferase
VADVSVRPARADDIGEIARIQLDTWRTGYAEVLPAGVLESITTETATAAWEQAVTAPPSPKHHVFLALEKDSRVGFAATAPADDLQAEDPEPDSTVAIGALLVEPRWGRRGHGSRLLAASIDHAREDGMTRAIMWIPEADMASREFLVSAGWAPDGLARVLDTGAGELREIRLHVSLSAGVDPAA